MTNKFPTKNQMRAAKIFNSYDMAAMFPEAKVWISVVAADTGRGGHSARVKVHGIGFDTDSKAHWADYGSKTFIVWGRDTKEETIEEAKLWANEKFGPRVWVRNPYGDWLDARVLPLIWGKVNGE